jgi:hypothetical protein
MILESSQSVDVKANSKILTVAIEEFDKVRRFVSLMDLSGGELEVKQYIYFSKEEMIVTM